MVEAVENVAVETHSILSRWFARPQQDAHETVLEPEEEHPGQSSEEEELDADDGDDP